MAAKSANSPASGPQDASDKGFLEDWKKAQDKCRQSLQGTSFQQGLRFESASEVYDDLLALKDSQDNAIRELVNQLRPCLDIMQETFLILAMSSPLSKLETRLFFGLLYLLITVRKPARASHPYLRGPPRRRHIALSKTNFIHVALSRV